MVNNEKVESFVSEINNIFKKLTEFQELYKEYTPRNVFEIDMKTYNPIVIIFSSDIHFGSIYTDYTKIINLWKDIVNRNRLYLIVVGDFIDNFDLLSIKHLQAGINSQLITPQLQRDIFVQYIQTLADLNKIIACVLGNHEVYSKKYPYYSFLKNVPVYSNRMLLKINVGSESYKIALIHQSKFNSSINPAYSNLMELMNNYPDADVVVTSHTHNPIITIYPYPSEGLLKERILIKTGTLKKDPYQISNFNEPNTDHAIPAVVFSPLKRKLIPFLDYEDAIKFMISWG